MTTSIEIRQEPKFELLAEAAARGYKCHGPWVEKLFGPGAVVAAVDALAPTVCMIRDRRGVLQKLRPNAAQVRYVRERGPRNIILKARQLGITTWMAARLFLSTITIPGTVTLQVAHTQESAQQIFRIVRRFLEHLGRDVGRYFDISRDTLRELAFARMDSRYIVDTAGNESAGRGLSIRNLHASEVAMWPGRPEETMAALLAAVAPGGAVEIESTPKGAGGYFHAAWLRATAGPANPLDFTAHFFPWWIEPAYELPLAPGESLEPLADDELHLLEKENLTLEKIKFRRAFRHNIGSLAAQEYAESSAECFLLSGRPVFEVAAIEARLRQLPAPVRVAENGAELVWLPPQPGRQYIIAADIAEGNADGDYSAAVVFDANTLLQCAELVVRWPIARFAAALAGLGRRYNQAQIAVERNNHGHAVLYALQYQLNYPNLFRHFDGKPGWLTNALTRWQAINVLGQFLRESPELFASPRLLEQCRNFSYLDNGETGALPGSHDDLVMAAAIGLTVRSQPGAVQRHEVSR